MDEDKMLEIAIDNYRERINDGYCEKEAKNYTIFCIANYCLGEDLPLDVVRYSDRAIKFFEENEEEIKDGNNN